MTKPITITLSSQEPLTISDYIHFSKSTETKLDYLANLTGKSYSQIIDDSIRFFYAHLLEEVKCNSTSNH